MEQRFLAFVLSKEGRPYCWPHPSNGYSGKDLASAKYRDTYDCSGLVTAGVYHATEGAVDWRAMVGSASLYEALPLLEKPEPLCLAFYGKPGVSHVMVCMEDGRVYGARGGNHATLTPEIAARQGASVRWAPTAAYRKDLRGFRRLFPLPQVLA